MGGRKTEYSIELHTDQLEWLKKMRLAYGLFDESKALRVILDYVMETADPSVIFEEIRCSHCHRVSNQD